MLSSAILSAVNGGLSEVLVTLPRLLAKVTPQIQTRFYGTRWRTGSCIAHGCGPAVYKQQFKQGAFAQSRSPWHSPLGPASFASTTVSEAQLATGARHFDTLEHSVLADAFSGRLDSLVSAVVRCVQEDVRDAHVLQRLATMATSRAQEMSPNDIMNLTVSFAKLGHFDVAFKSAMADAIIEKIHAFEPTVLADTAWAFGELQYYDFDLMAQLLPYLKANAEKFDACELSKMLWTFGRVGYNDATLMDLMHDIALKLHSKYDSRSMADVVFAEAQMGWSDARVHNLVADYAVDNIHAFDAPSLAKLVYGMASMGYEDEELYQAAMRRTVELLPEMSPQDICRIIWAVGELGYYNKEFLSAVAEVTVGTRLQTFSPTQLSTMVQGFNKLGYSGPRVAEAAQALSDVLPHMEIDHPEVNTEARLAA